MTMRFHPRRTMAAALAAAVTLTSLNLTPAQAAAPKSTDQSQVTQSTAATTEFSARRRWHRGNTAALGAVIGMFGAIAAIAAADRYRNRYYYGDPYYGGYGYGGSYGYAPGYRYGHHHHHRR